MQPSQSQSPPPQAPAPAPPSRDPVEAPRDSFVVTIIPATPAEEQGVADVILGSLGVAGSLLMLALVLGVFVAGCRVAWNRRHPPADDHLPPVVPTI